MVALKKSVNEKTLKGTNTGTGTVPVFLCCHCRVREKMYFTSLFCESLDRMNSQSSESPQQNEYKMLDDVAEVRMRAKWRKKRMRRLKRKRRKMR